MYLAIPQPCPALSSNPILVFGYFLSFASALLLLLESALFLLTARRRRPIPLAFGGVALALAGWCGFVGYGAWTRRFWSEVAAVCGFRVVGTPAYTVRDVVLWQDLTIVTLAVAVAALVIGGVALRRSAPSALSRSA